MLTVVKCYAWHPTSELTPILLKPSLLFRQALKFYFFIKISYLVEEYHVYHKIGLQRVYKSSSCFISPSSTDLQSHKAAVMNSAVLD